MPPLPLTVPPLSTRPLPPASMPSPDELAEPSEVLSGCRKDLAEVAKSSHARKPDDVGAIYRRHPWKSSLKDLPYWVTIRGIGLRRRLGC